MMIDKDTYEPEGKDRSVRLIAPKEVEKVWAAVKFLSDLKAEKAGIEGESCWVSIDEIGEFLKKRQIDAHRVKFDAKNPNTRYAIHPNVVSSNGWDDDHSVVAAIVEAKDKRLLDHLRKEEVNYFTYVPISDKNLWKVKNTDTPFLEEWKRNHHE